MNADDPIPSSSLYEDADGDVPLLDLTTEESSSAVCGEYAAKRHVRRDNALQAKASLKTELIACFSMHVTTSNDLCGLVALQFDSYLF